MIDKSLDQAIVPIDQASAYALEQMALTEGRSIAEVLQAAINARWHAHREAERLRRESFMNDRTDKTRRRRADIVDLEDFHGENRGD